MLSEACIQLKTSKVIKEFFEEMFQIISDFIGYEFNELDEHIEAIFKRFELQIERY